MQRVGPSAPRGLARDSEPVEQRLLHRRLATEACARRGPCGRRRRVAGGAGQEPRSTEPPAGAQPLRLPAHHPAGPASLESLSAPQVRSLFHPIHAAPLVTPPAHDAPSYHGDLVYALRRKLRLKRPENAPEPGEDDTDLYQVLVASCPMLEVYYYHARHTLTRTLIS